MAWGRKEINAPDARPAKAPRSLVASAARIRISETSSSYNLWNSYKFKDEAWQRELWRLYDIIGEFHFASNWVGSAVSRVRIYVAEVDKLGRLGPEAERPDKVVALADTIFGGPAAKAEALRAIGINLTVGGECFILGIGADDPTSDEWHVVAPAELRRIMNSDTGMRELAFGDRKEPRKLVEGKDILMRVWSPHPRQMQKSDCPARAAQPVLREIEQLTKYVFAQIDSRLFGAGLLPIPSNIDFPEEEGVETASESLLKRLAEAGQASLKGEGTAASLLPIIMEMPPETLDKIKLVSFATELSQQALDLRAEAVRRFALAMDMPPEVVSGTGDTNHWSAWHIEESAVKVHIEPLMSRICDALTKGYLQPALKALNVDPNKYTFWYDTSPLTVRPQRLQDTLNLYDKQVVSAEAVRAAGNYLDSDAPDEDEDLRRFARELLLRDPSMTSIPEMRSLAGLPEFAPPPALDTPAPPPPAPESNAVPTQPDPLPVNSTAANAPNGPARNNTNAVVASAAMNEQWMGLAVASEAMVRNALRVAGTRLLTPSDRGRWPDVPRHELHTRKRPTGNEQIERLLTGAWESLPHLVSSFGLEVNVDRLEKDLRRYCTVLLAMGVPHETNRLLEVLRTGGYVNGSA
jgi:hypothetical protein